MTQQEAPAVPPVTIRPSQKAQAKPRVVHRKERQISFEWSKKFPDGSVAIQTISDPTDPRWDTIDQTTGRTVMDMEAPGGGTLLVEDVSFDKDDKEVGKTVVACLARLSHHAREAIGIVLGGDPNGYDK